MPTENISTIDPGGGGDYLTIAAWEAATDNDLVSADVIEIGELVSGTHSTSATTVSISGATTDSTRYRILRAAAGARYDPITGTGALISHTGAGYPFQILEEGFRMEGFGINWATASPTASNSGILWFTDSTNANSVAAIADGLTIISGLTGANGVNKCFWVHPSCDYPVIWRNCVAISDAGGNMQAGFRGTFLAGSKVQNCVAKGGFVDGFNTEADTAFEISNCVAYGASDKDFDLAGTTNTVVQNCASSDATATGTGAITSIVAADEFVDPANNDFRLKGTGQLFGAGTDLSADFTTDIAGDTWGPWSIGAYRATSLEVWSNGAWGPADPLTGVNQGRVTYYRWTKIQTTNADSDPIPTAGANRVIAYLGTVTSGSGASGGFRINPLPYPRASATLEPDIPVAAGKRHIAGVIDTDTPASNTAAVCFAPSGAASIYLRNLDTTSSPIIDIVIEVHR